MQVMQGRLSASNAACTASVSCHRLQAKCMWYAASHAAVMVFGRSGQWRDALAGMIWTNTSRWDRRDGLVRLVDSMAVWLHSSTRATSACKSDASLLDALTSTRWHVIQIQQGSQGQQASQTYTH
jgi:hypothetical protein